MAVNRYSQGVNAQFNPLSMQEIARYPEMLMAKEEATIAALDSLNTALPNVLDEELSGVQGEVEKFNKKRTDLINRLKKRGVNSGVGREAIALRQEYNNLFGAEGAVGKAHENLNKYERDNALLKQLQIERGFDPNVGKLLQQKALEKAASTGKYEMETPVLFDSTQRRIDQIVNAIRSGQTEGYGITKQSLQGGVVYTINGTTHNTLDGAIAAAVENELRNDPNAQAYFNQRFNLGVETATPEQQIKEFAKRYDQVYKLDNTKEGEEYQDINLTTSRNTNKVKENGKDIWSDPFANAAMKMKGVPKNSKERMNLQKELDLGLMSSDEAADAKDRIAKFDYIETAMLSNPAYKEAAQNTIMTLTNLISDEVASKAGLEKEFLAELITKGDKDGYTFSTNTSSLGTVPGPSSTSYTVTTPTGQQINLPNTISRTINNPTYKTLKENLTEAKETALNSGIIGQEEVMNAVNNKDVFDSTLFSTVAYEAIGSKYDVTVEEDGQVKTLSEKSQWDDERRRAMERKTSEAFNTRLIFNEADDVVKVQLEYIDSNGKAVKLTVPANNIEALETMLSEERDQGHADMFRLKSTIGKDRASFDVKNPSVLSSEKLKKLNNGDQYHSKFEGAGFVMAPPDSEDAGQVYLNLGHKYFTVGDRVKYLELMKRQPNPVISVKAIDAEIEMLKRQDLKNHFPFPSSVHAAAELQFLMANPQIEF